jgi:hypothetical protein
VEGLETWAASCGTAEGYKISEFSERELLVVCEDEFANALVQQMVPMALREARNCAKLRREERIGPASSNHLRLAQQVTELRCADSAEEHLKRTLYFA